MPPRPAALRAAANRPDHPFRPADLPHALQDAESYEITIEGTPWTDVHRAWELSEQSLRYADAVISGPQRMLFASRRAPQPDRPDNPSSGVCHDRGRFRTTEETTLALGTVEDGSSLLGSVEPAQHSERTVPVPTSTAVPAWLNGELYPFDNHFLDIDGNRIHYVDQGSGPTLLMVHGNPVWSFVYSSAIKALRDSFRCVAVDLAGFGLSEAAPGFSYLPAAQSALLAKFIEQLDLRDYSVVVHDWGGPIGLSAALVAPERLSGVVISNTWAWPVNGNPGFEKFSGLMGGPLGRFGSKYFNSFVNVLVPLSHKRRRLTHAEMTQYRKPLPFGRRTPTWVLPKQIIDAREFLAALESRLPELSTRHALILWGDKDDAFEAPELARWQQILPGARTVILQGVGHFAASEAPAEFVAAIREWHVS